MDCSLPGSSVHGISQARVLEWVAIAFSTKLKDWAMGHRRMVTARGLPPERTAWAAVRGVGWNRARLLQQCADPSWCTDAEIKGLRLEGKEQGALGNRVLSWVGVRVSEGPIQPEDIDEDGSLRDGVEVPGPWGSGEGSGLDLSRGREWPG